MCVESTRWGDIIELIEECCAVLKVMLMCHMVYHTTQNKLAAKHFALFVVSDDSLSNQEGHKLVSPKDLLIHAKTISNASHMRSHKLVAQRTKPSTCVLP